MSNSERCPHCEKLVFGSECKNCGYILYDEHQCSNCGYYDVEEETEWDVEKQKVVPSDAYEESVELTKIWTIMFVVVSIIPYLLTYITPGLGYTIILVFFLIYAFVVWDTVRGAYEPEEKVVNREVDRVRYECNECGYRWSVNR